MPEPESNDITPEQSQMAQQLGIDTSKITPDDAPGGDEFEPDMHNDEPYRQTVISHDQYVAPLKQVFGGAALLRGEHWAMDDEEALNISTAAVKAFPETELPPTLQFFSLLFEAVGRRIFIDLAHRPENQEKDVTPKDGEPDPFDESK